MRPRRAGGGLAALRYSLAKAREAGGVRVLVRRLSAQNACKTCAIGMSGMRNESGSFPEVCKKGVQAQAADMQPPIGEDFFRAHDLDALARLTSREREVLALMSQGLANADIGGSLAISEKTVRNHVSNLFDKLGVWTRAQAIVFARDRGFRP